MELHQIRYFLAVCEALNFTRAATACHVSQPSLTRAIKLLELELGGPLFNRERGNTHLTELGASVAPHLREALAQAAAAHGRARSLFALREARLALGVAAGVAPTHLATVLRDYARGHPEVAIAVLEDTPDRLHDAIRRGEIELAFLAGRPHDIDDLHYHAIGVDRAQLLLAGSHRLAGHGTARIADLAQETLAVWAGCRWLPRIEERLARADQMPGRRLTCRTPAMVPALVEASGCIGLREAGFGIPPGLFGCLLVELAEPGPIHVATKRGRPYSPPVKAFVELLLRRAAPAGQALRS